MSSQAILRSVAFSVFVAAAAVCAGAEPVRNDPVAAEALFREARVLLRQGDRAGACRKWQTSMELDPSAGTQTNIAWCREQEGKLVTAWRGYSLALELNERERNETTRRARAQYIAERIAELEARFAKLKLVVRDPPAGLTIQRDGQLVSVAVLGEAVPMDPGAHEIVISAPAHQSERRTVSLLEGKTEELVVELKREPALRSTEPRSPPAPATPRLAQSRTIAPPPQAPQRRPSQKTTALGVGAAGVGALDVAAYFGLRTLSLVEDSNVHCDYAGGRCNRDGIDLRDRARRAQTVGIVTAVAGSLALGTGIILFTTARDSRDTAVRLEVRANAAAGRVQW